MKTNKINTTLIDIKKKESFHDEIYKYVQYGDYESATNLLKTFSHVEVVKFLEVLNYEQRLVIINSYSIDEIINLIEYLPDYIIQEIVDSKGTGFIADIIKKSKLAHNLDLTDADLSYLLLKDLDIDEQEEILEHLSFFQRVGLEERLNYPKDSAATIMHTNFISVLSHWTVLQCAVYIKKVQNIKPINLEDIIITDSQGKAVGSVKVHQVLLSEKTGSNVMSLSDKKNFKTIYYKIDQEEVALLFRNKDFDVLGVVNSKGVLMGVIEVNSVIDVIYKEVEEDFLLATGVEGESQFSHRYLEIVKVSGNRFKWLFINFAEVLVISFIVSHFAETLERNIILSALIQFVVALGGNAGLQTLSLTLRGLALKVISKANAVKQIKKELAIAFINGILLGIIGLIWGFIWGNGILMGVVAFLAVLANIIIGVFFGVIVPLILKRMSIDPAIASSLFVTIFTDILGYFIVLLISTILLV